MYKTILCAIDLKRKADKAFEQAVHFAHQYKSKIVLLNVNDDFQTKEDMIMSRVSIDKISTRYKEIALKAKNEMDQLQEKLETDSVDIDIMLRKGKPGVTILEVSEEINADLIVIGANGKDSIADYFLGTTAAYVSEHSKIPTLTVPII